jgi:HD-GYP domain-containing protein (c-di-GMP phosphodiesterase class II)
MGIPDRILKKPDKLSHEERELINMHPIFARNMLEQITFLKPALDIPFYHHERWDGNGYPEGLRGTDIPLPARIFAVVDVWDALTSDRPYRSPLSQDEVIAYLREFSEIEFDPVVVKTFIKLLAEAN